MIGHKRVPSCEEGIEIIVEELSTRMVAMGQEVTCYNRAGHHVCSKEFDARNKKTEYKGVKLKTVPIINRKGLAAISSYSVGAIMAAFSRCDVVHFHAEESCVILWIPKLFGKRCVAIIHGLRAIIWTIRENADSIRGFMA